MRKDSRETVLGTPATQRPSRATGLHCCLPPLPAHDLEALDEQLNALSVDDPRREELQKAGDQLANMLFFPDTTLSLKEVSPDTLGRLMDNGLLACFADQRNAIHPAPTRLVLPAAAQHLLPRMSAFPTIQSVRLHQ